MNKIIFPLIWMISLTSCFSYGYEIKNGKITRNGNIFYQLCERGKRRVTDLHGMSFELSELFKQAPCTDWSDYVYR